MSSTPQSGPNNPPLQQPSEPPKTQHVSRPQPTLAHVVAGPQPATVPPQYHRTGSVPPQGTYPPSYIPYHSTHPAVLVHHGQYLPSSAPIPMPGAPYHMAPAPFAVAPQAGGAASPSPNVTPGHSAMSTPNGTPLSSTASPSNPKPVAATSASKSRPKRMMENPDTGYVFDPAAKNWRPPTDEEIAEFNLKVYREKNADAATQPAKAEGVDKPEEPALAPVPVPDVKVPQEEKKEEKSEAATSSSVPEPSPVPLPTPALAAAPPLVPVPVPAPVPVPSASQDSLDSESRQDQSENSAGSVDEGSEDGSSYEDDESDEDDSQEGDEGEPSTPTALGPEIVGGKKHYSKEALLAFRTAPLSRPMPLNLAQTMQSLIKTPGGETPKSGRSDRRSSHAGSSMSPKGGKDRGDRTGRKHGRRESTTRPGSAVPNPNEPPVELSHRSENRWNPMAKAKDAVEATEREAKIILNKITHENYDKLKKELGSAVLKLLHSAVDANEADQIMTSLTSVIYDKAVWEPFFSEMYARLCSEFCSPWAGMVSDAKLLKEIEERKYDPPKQFRLKILNECQRQFTAGIDFSVLDTLTGDERDEREMLLRKKMTGNITFIGELYLRKVLAANVVRFVLRKLLGVKTETELVNPPPEDIEQVCKLLNVVGASLDAVEETRQVLMFCIARMKTLAELKDAYPSRIRFMLRDVIDLRQNKWQGKRVTKQQSKSEVEDSMKRERDEKERMANSVGSGYGGGMRRVPSSQGMASTPRGGRSNAPTNSGPGRTNRREGRGSSSSLPRMSSQDEITLAPQRPPPASPSPKPVLNATPFAAAAPSDEACENRLRGTMDEFLSVGDAADATMSMVELNKKEFYPKAVSLFMLRYIDARREQQQGWLPLFAHWCMPSVGLFSAEDISLGAVDAISQAIEADLACDIPKIWELFGELLAQAFMNDVSISSLFREIESRNLVAEQDSGVISAIAGIYRKMWALTASSSADAVEEEEDDKDSSKAKPTHSSLMGRSLLDARSTSVRLFAHPLNVAALENLGRTVREALHLDVGLYIYTAIRSGESVDKILSVVCPVVDSPRAMGRSSLADVERIDKPAAVITFAVLLAIASNATTDGEVASVVDKYRALLLKIVSVTADRQIASIAEAAEFYSVVADETFLQSVFGRFYEANVWVETNLRQWRDFADKGIVSKVQGFFESLDAAKERRYEG